MANFSLNLKRSKSATEEASAPEYWVIEHKGKVEALLRANDELDAKKQAIWWARGRMNKGVLWRNIHVRPQGDQNQPSQRQLPKIPKLQLSRPENLHQPILLVGLIGILGWLWRDLI